MNGIAPWSYCLVEGSFFLELVAVRITMCPEHLVEDVLTTVTINQGHKS